MHSFWLWGLIGLCGLLWAPLYFIGLGGVFHILADCATVSGVRAFAPWSNKLFVIFRREWRLTTGTPAEMVVMLIFGVVAWGGGHIGSMGGIQALLGHLTGSPKIMMEEYISKGLTKCFVEGKIRWKNGEITEGRWLIIGKEGSSGLALLAEGGERLIHIPKSGEFLKARLKPTKEKWQAAQLKGWVETEIKTYQWDGQKWILAKPGQMVWGQILGDQLKLKNT